MNRGHYKWIAIAFLILGILRFAHSMHWIDGAHDAPRRFGSRDEGTMLLEGSFS